MTALLNTALSQTKIYYPVMIGSVLAIALLLIQRAIVKYFGTDVFQGKAVLGLVLLIAIITLSNLIINEREVTGMTYVIFGSMFGSAITFFVLK